MGEEGPSKTSHEAPNWISAWTLRACYEGAARSFDSTTLIAKPFLNLTHIVFQSMTFSHFGDTSKKPKLLSSNGKLPCMTPLLNKTCTLIARGPAAVRSTDYPVHFLFLFFLSSKLPVHFDTSHYFFPCTSPLSPVIWHISNCCSDPCNQINFFLDIA